jgi:uncharacterized protein
VIDEARCPRALPEAAIPKRKAKTARPKGSTAGGPRAAKRRPAPPVRPPTPRRRRSRPRAEQPLGAGVGDAFAVQRLEVPPEVSRARPNDRVREVGWAEFGELARGLADRIGTEFHPEVVLGVVNGGVFLGGALAASFKAEFRPLRVRKFAGRAVSDAVKGVRGKRVLVVDDVTASGQTLTAARASTVRGGAAEVRTGVLVVRPTRHQADFFALKTDQLIVFGWDYQLLGEGGEPGSDPGEVGV